MEELRELRRCKTSAEYRVVKHISKGSYGDVFLAERLCDGHQVCLKQVDLDFISPHERRGCLAEVQLLQSLPQHRNVVACYDAFWDVTKDFGGSNRIVITLEYGDCGDLDSFIQAEYASQRTLPLEVALSIFAQIASGLAFLHARYILHRDIKSKNMFRFSDGRVVIGDFGTCKSLAHTTALANTLVGSPLYVSPELLEDQPYSFSSDVWSLGCVLYELLTGRTPFVASSYPAVVFKITKGVFDPLPSSQPTEIQALVTRMLCLDPNERPTLREILEDPFVSRYVTELATETSSLQPSEPDRPHNEVKPVDGGSRISEVVTGSASEEDVHLVLPPPAPAVEVRASASVQVPTEPPLPPPPKQSRVSQHKPRSGSTVFPTNRSRLADILSKERLNVHKTSRHASQSHLSLSCVPILDSSANERPAGQHAGQIKKKQPASKTSANSTVAKPFAAVPPENMMIIGTKVQNVRSNTLPAKEKVK